MGSQASVQTTTNSIDESIINELNQVANASATTNCIININSIRLEKSENCTFSIVNNCSANAGASFTAILDTIKTLISEMSTDQKTATASLLTASLNVQTSISNISQTFENHVNQECSSKADVVNSININSINLGTCINTTGSLMELKFINSGQSKANCVMTIINKLKAESVTRVSTQTDMGTNYVQIMKVIVIAVCVLGGFSLVVSISIIFIKNLKEKHRNERKIAYINSNRNSTLDKYIPYI